jgi:uncharacterized membrane protein YjgN (DUF898 family)
MKRYFDFTLEGREWWAPFIVFWVLYLLIMGALQVFTGSRDSEGAGLGLLLNLSFTIILVLVQSIFTIVLLRIAAPKASFGGHAFAFSGSVGTYVGLNLKGILLSIITVSIYAPWYLRNILSYLASHTTYRGATLEFMGKPGRLLKYFLLALYLPVIVISVGVGVVITLVVLRGSHGSEPGATRLAMALMVFIVFLILIPFLYLAFKWYVDVQWTNLRTQLRTEFWPSCGFVLCQLLLSMSTVGIYGPAAVLRIYRYFANRTVIIRGDSPASRLGFDGSIGTGFGLLWGQGPA